MSKTVKCIIRQDWETRNANGELLDRQRRVYVTNEDGTPHIYNSIKEARAEIRANYGRDANRHGILHNHTAEDYSGNVHDSFITIVREDSEEYAEATAAAEVAPYIVCEDQSETATAENYEAEDAATNLINAYALAIGEYPRETDPEYIAAYHVASDEITGTNRATAEDLQHVAAMVEAIAEFDREQRDYISANNLEHYTTPFTVWEIDADADQDATAEAEAAAREAWAEKSHEALTDEDGEGIYQIKWSDGGQPFEPAHYGSVEDLTSDLLAAYEDATETHLPYAEPVREYQRYELEAYLGEPADYDVDAIEAEATAYTSAGLQYWTADAETLISICERYQIAEYIPA